MPVHCHITGRIVRVELIGNYAPEDIVTRCALLAGTATQYGMARMGSLFAESPGVEAEVFTPEEEARHWLLRDEPE